MPENQIPHNTNEKPEESTSSVGLNQVNNSAAVGSDVLNKTSEPAEKQKESLWNLVLKNLGQDAQSKIQNKIKVIEGLERQIKESQAEKKQKREELQKLENERLAIEKKIQEIESLEKERQIVEERLQELEDVPKRRAAFQDEMEALIQKEKEKKALEEKLQAFGDLGAERHALEKRMISLEEEEKEREDLERRKEELRGLHESL